MPARCWRRRSSISARRAWRKRTPHWRRRGLRCGRRLPEARRLWFRALSEIAVTPDLFRGSNAPQALALVEGWMPEQVRHVGLLQQRRSHLAGGAGTVAERVFGVGIHLADGLVAAIGQDAGTVRSDGRRCGEEWVLPVCARGGPCIKK